MVWKSRKTKVKFVSEIPLPVALFYMTQPADSASLSWTIAFLRTGANSDAKRGLEVVSLRGEVSCSKCEWDFSLSVGNHAFPSCGKAAEVKLPEERASHSLHPRLPKPSCNHRSPGWLCLSQQLTFHGWGRGRREPVEWNGCGCREGTPSPGEGRARHHLAQGILPASSWILWIVHPSAHCEDGDAECPKAVQ